MRKKSIIILIALVLSINGCIQQTGPGIVQSAPCNWVFKTGEDYSNLVSVSLNSDKPQIINYPFFDEIKKLDRNYYTAVQNCAYSDKMNIAFTSITWDEWEQSQEDCDIQIENKRNQLRIEKCGSLNFDIFEACNIFQARGEKLCSIAFLRQGSENPTKCTYNITLEENKWVNNCETSLSTNDFLNNIANDDPFIELYLCNAQFNELNSIITNDKLNIECKKEI